MPRIEAVATAVPPHVIEQEESMALVRHFFRDAFVDIDRLLGIFANGQIRKRHFCVPPEWFRQNWVFAEKNRLYLQHAEALAIETARSCLDRAGVPADAVDCLMFVSSTGIATPSLDSRIMHQLGLRPDITRIPMWGLGCAGGAMGLSRACDFARAYPESRILLVCVELCGLTFIRQDMSKSNLVATSLFGDGAAAVLVEGDAVPLRRSSPRLHFSGAQTTTWPQTQDVMGWEVTEPGLKVVFSRDIPTLIRRSMRENVDRFLSPRGLSTEGLDHFIFHPGGAKVLAAYQHALGLDADATRLAEEVLLNYGNMSSPTVLFVLEKSMEQNWEAGDKGLLAALGPGFSSELLLLERR